MESGKPRLPEGWRLARLGEISEIIAGQSPPGETYRKTPTGLPFFQGKADFGVRHPVARTWCISPTKIALPGDILISVRAPVGPTNVADVECCIGRGLAAIRPKGSADRDFILAGLRFLEQKIERLGSGSTFGAIRREDLESLEIPVPPPPQQKRIAAILNEQMAAVERARAAAEAQLEAANALPTAYLRAVFDSPEACRWPRRLLSEISEITGGIQKTPDRKPVAFHRRYLTVRNVQRGCLDLSQVERFEVTPAELSRLRLHDGDILIVEGNGSRDHIGRNALFVADGDEWIHQNHIIRARLSPGVCLPAFASRYLNSDQGREQMLEKAKTTSGLYTLSAGKVASLEVPTPCIAEQERMVAMLNEQMASADRTRKAVEQELETVNKLPAAFLRRAFDSKT